MPLAGKGTSCESGLNMFRPLVKECVNFTYVVGTQKNRLNETILLSTKTYMYVKLIGRKISRILRSKICLSKPVISK